MKRLRSLFCAACLVLSLFAGCAGGDAGAGEGGDVALVIPEGSDPAFLKFPEPVDIHIGRAVNPVDKTLPQGDSAENNQFTRHLLEHYNINVIVDWTAAEGDDYKQKLSLAIAGNSLPDGVVATERSFLLKAAKSDMLYDLTEVYEQYASEQVKGIMDSTEGIAIELASHNGRMLSIPSVTLVADGIHVMHLRKDWLDMYHLEVPKTPADIEAVARVFRSEQPAGDQTIPVLGPDKSSKVYANFLEMANNSHGLDPVFSAMDAYPGYWLEEDGEIIYGTTTESTKQALELLARWYGDGLLDPELGTRDNSGEAVNANQVGIFFGPWWDLGYGNPESWSNDPGANWQSYPVYTEDGRWYAHMNTVGSNYTLINKNASENVAIAAMIMQNVVVRDETTFDPAVSISWWPLRNNMGAADDSEYTYRELVKVLGGDASPGDYDDTASIYKHLYRDVQGIRDLVPGYQPGKELSIADFNREIEGDFPRAYAVLIGARPCATIPIDKKVYSATTSVTETMEKKWSNLKKLEDEMVLKIITGKTDSSVFDEFVQNWHAQGGDEILREVEEECFS